MRIRIKMVSSGRSPGGRGPATSDHIFMSIQFEVPGAFDLEVSADDAARDSAKSNHGLDGRSRLDGYLRRAVQQRALDVVGRELGIILVQTVQIVTRTRNQG